MAENINVVARVRPFSGWIGGEQHGSSCVTMDPSTSTIFIKTAQQAKKFNVNKAFDQHTKQKTIYADVGQRIVNGFVEGINGTIFAYGQTGSGKTFTMLGPEAQDRTSFDRQNRGVIPRAIEDVFDLLDGEAEKNPKTFKYTMRCSFLELYNERLYDLLQESNEAIKVQAGVDRQICVIGAAEIEVSSSDQCMDLLWKGWNQRKVAETAMNRESSRSHAVFMLSLQTETIEGLVLNRRSSRLNLVDLAGSERQGHTNNTGDRLKEASNINKSLTFLARVIRTLATSKKPEHVPYRDSQLTYLLKDSLGGNARTAVIVNIHPNKQFFGETISTLQFAENCKKIQNTAQINEAVSCNDVAAWKVEIERLRAENRLLKDQLQMASSTFQAHELNHGPQAECHQSQRILTAEERKERRQTKFIPKRIHLEAASDDEEDDRADLQRKFEEEERLRMECEMKLDQQNQLLAEKDARIKRMEQENQLLAEKDDRIKQLEQELASVEMRCDHEKEFEKLQQKYESALTLERRMTRQEMMARQEIAERLKLLESWDYEKLVEELRSKNAELVALKEHAKKMTEDQGLEIESLQLLCETLKNEKEAVKKQRDVYLTQLNDGAGHVNHAQKIKHLEKMKNDLMASKNENAKLRSLLKTYGLSDKDIAFQRSQ